MKFSLAFLISFIFSLHVLAMELAPINQALTLSRVEINHQIHTLLITQVDNSTVSAIDLSIILNEYPAYPLDIFKNNKDFSFYISLIQNNTETDQYLIKNLLPATNNHTLHVGAAGNYPEHANETNLDPNNVFMFPKLGEILGSNTNLNISTTEDSLLDYEVEVCTCFDRDIFEIEDFQQAIVGIYICNDWSDRSYIIRKFDSKHPELAGGLTDAKSQPGYYTAGQFLVVPYNVNSFIKTITLKLSLNGEIRQNESVSKISTSLENLVDYVLKNGNEANWYIADENISMISKGYFEKGMTILTGTPSGTIFTSPSKKTQLKYALSYIITGVFGPFYHQTLNDYVREKYIKALVKKNIFLKPGDKIISYGTYLGEINTSIVAK